MTREEKEQTGKYVLQMARLLEDGCYQQEMLLKAVRIIDEALEQEPREITLEDVKRYCEPRCLTIISNELLYELTHPKIKALEQEPCEDTISRKSIKQKLQEHHDFFVNAYGGFSNLPLNDKSRVDEITNCIAMVVNEPSVTPQEPITNFNIPFLMHKELDIPISECQKAYNTAIEYLKSTVRVKG